MFTALLSSNFHYEAKLVLACILTIFYVNNVVRQMSELVDQSLTVDLVENTTSVVIPRHP